MSPLWVCLSPLWRPVIGRCIAIEADKGEISEKLWRRAVFKNTYVKRLRKPFLSKESFSIDHNVYLVTWAYHKFVNPDATTARTIIFSQRFKKQGRPVKALSEKVWPVGGASVRGGILIKPGLPLPVIIHTTLPQGSEVTVQGQVTSRQGHGALLFVWDTGSASDWLQMAPGACWVIVGL